MGWPYALGVLGLAVVTAWFTGDLMGLVIWGVGLVVWAVTRGGDHEA